MCLSYQVVEISRTFFTYDVQTANSFYVPSKIKTPGLSVCFRYGDIIDYDQVNKKYPEANLSYEAGLENDFESLQNTLTINDIFDMTPSDPFVLIFCAIRFKGSYFLKDYHGSDECHKVYDTVTKYYVMRNICYKFNFTKRYSSLEVAFDQVAYSYDYPGLMFQISLNVTSFRRAEHFRALVHDEHQDPTGSLGLAEPIRRLYNQETQEGEFNNFLIDFYESFVERLEAPYKTKCRTYIRHRTGQRISQKDCLNLCISRQTQDYFNKVMFNQVERYGKDMGHVTRRLLENSTVNDIFEDFQSRCVKICSQIPCIEEMSITRIDVLPTDPIGLDFRVLSPMHMYYKTIYEPCLNLMSYFVYCSSCTALWFGLALWNFNPVHYLTICCLKWNRKQNWKVNVINLWKRKNSSTIQRKQGVNKNNWKKTLRRKSVFMNLNRYSFNHSDYTLPDIPSVPRKYSDELYFSRHQITRRRPCLVRDTLYPLYPLRYVPFI